MVDFDTEDGEGDSPSQSGNEVVNPTPMPTMVQDPYIQDNQLADSVRNAHPVEEATIETVVGDVVPTLEFDLAAIQAVADGLDILTDDESVQLITEQDGVQYYQVDSATFYRLAAAVNDEYETYIEVEALLNVMEAHTRQFLESVHGFDGDFEHDATLCDAYNNPNVREGVVRDETEPEAGHYAFVDSRGLVVKKGTHE